MRFCLQFHKSYLIRENYSFPEVKDLFSLKIQILKMYYSLANPILRIENDGDYQEHTRSFQMGSAKMEFVL